MRFPYPRAKGFSMSKLPFMPLYVPDYDGATNYLSVAEDGMYLRALRLMWVTPGCSIPNDKDWILRRMRITEAEYDTFLYVKEEFFTVKRRRLCQKRLQEEFGKANGIIKARSEAGKKGGRPKSLNKQEIDESKGSNLLKQNESKPKASTSTSTTTASKKETPCNPPKGGKRKSQIPNGFPDEKAKTNAKAYWLKKGRTDLNVDDQADEFRTYCEANGKRFLDWNAGFKTWYVRAIKFNKKQEPDKGLFERALDG